MAAQIELKSKTGSKSGPCSCGCAPCDETSCGLDCVVQPRYFCGQLLTDADLTAGVTWSQGKFRLARRRDGWGVACGLDVACGPAPGMITIRPGYAVDCCGDDIIVCSDAMLDLNKLFQQAPKECEPGQRKPVVETGKRIEDGEVVAVDIYIHYQEDGILPTTTLGRSACGQSGECEYSRVKEGHWLAGKMIRQGGGEIPTWSDPLQAAVNRWESELEAYFKPLAKDLEPYGPQPTAEQLQQVMIGWLEKHPTYQLCSLNGFLTSNDPEKWLDENKRSNNPGAAEYIFLVVQDGINRYIARTCSTCEDEGVPLARAWLKAGVSLGKTQWSVLEVFSLPPYRREQQPDALPAPLGKVNLGEVIWRSPDDARAILSRRGILLSRNPQEILLDDVNIMFDHFREFKNQCLLEIGGLYQPVLYRDPNSGEHLVGVNPYGQVWDARG